MQRNSRKKNFQYPPKLSKDKHYKRPQQTYTEKLQGDEDAIKKKLLNYEQVPPNEIEELKEGIHLRYFTSSEDDPSNFKFRVGGFLLKVHSTYLTLHNNKFSWNVKLKNSVFFRKLAKEDKMVNTILQQNQELDELRRKIQYLEEKMSNNS